MEALIVKFSVVFQFTLSTELYKINREHHRFLENEAENQQHFVAFAAPSSGQIWQIY